MKRLFLLLATGALLAIAVLTVADTTEFGPVLLDLDPGHGVHLGDLIVLLAAIGIFGYVMRHSDP